MGVLVTYLGIERNGEVKVLLGVCVYGYMLRVYDECGL